MLTPERDHLFISYAWEDAALADWLVRRLTVLGYRVWCDRFKLLGGERWPRDIDKAIKTRTFRMIALLSRFSITKENPSKERQLALALSKERKEDFLIPLNVDGMKPTELGWELSDVTWVPFTNWAAGLDQLATLLIQIGAPQSLGDRGPSAAIGTYAVGNFMTPEEEPVWSNCYEVTEMPQTLLEYAASRELFRIEQYHLAEHWPCYWASNRRFLSFCEPGEIANLPFTLSVVQSHATNTPTTLGIPTTDILTNLVKLGMFQHARRRGLTLTRDRTAYFPSGLLPKDKLSFRSYSGRHTTIAAVGERKFGSGRMRYNLGATFYSKLSLLPTPIIQVRTRLHITDPANPRLSGAAINARRKSVAKSWWNHEWISRQLAIVHFLADGGESIVISDAPERRLAVSATPLSGSVSPGIDDAKLAALRAKIKLTNSSVASVENDDVAGEVS